MRACREDLRDAPQDRRPPDGNGSGQFHPRDARVPGGTFTGGITSFGPDLWTSFTLINCTNGGRIYCLGTTKSAPLSPAPASGKRIYMTNQPYLPGNDPDAQCEADKPAGTGAVAALLSRTTQAAAALLGAGTTYVRPDGQSVGTGQKLIDVAAGTGELANGIWQTGDGTYGSFTTWAGASNMTALPVAETCTDWSVTTGVGRVGASSARTNLTYWSNTTTACSATTVRAYCVEQ